MKQLPEVLQKEKIKVFVRRDKLLEVHQFCHTMMRAVRMSDEEELSPEQLAQLESMSDTLSKLYKQATGRVREVAND